MPNLRMVGQMAADLYYQNYKSDDQFFDLEHFNFLLAAEYVKLIKAEATQNKRQNKIDTGFSYIEISPYWLKTEKVSVTEVDGKKISTLTEPVFQFDYDAMGSGIQEVYTVNNNTHTVNTPCGEVQRVSRNDRWIACAMPPNAKLFYFVSGNKTIEFVNVHCNLKEVEVTYVPGVECIGDDFEIHQDKVHDIIRSVLNTMFGAKNGNIVDMSDDSNPNTTPATELSNVAVPNR